jgi:hypothetical protein
MRPRCSRHFVDVDPDLPVAVLLEEVHAEGLGDEVADVARLDRDALAQLAKRDRFSSRWEM